MGTPSIRKNFAYTTLFQILSVILPFITAPYLSRVLGAEGVGIQSYTASVQTYFSLFAALGVTSYGAREISRCRDDRTAYSRIFWEIVLLKCMTSLVCLTAWGGLICFSSEYRGYYLILTLNLIATMLDITWLYNGLELFKIITVRDMAVKIVSLAAVFLFVKTEEDVGVYIFIMSMSLVATGIVTWAHVPRLVDRINWRELKVICHLKEVIVYFVPTIATSVYTVLDKTLLGIIVGDTRENGYYAQAEKIINIAKSIAFVSINSVVGVRISYLFVEKKIHEIHERIENSMNYILFMGIGCMCGIIGVAENFVPVFFGEGYEKVIGLLYIFSPIIVIVGISNCLGSHYYTPAGKRARSAGYLIVGAVINLVLNLLLIPGFSAAGAAVASVLAELVITILYVKMSDGFMDGKLLFKTGGKKLLAGVVMAVVVWGIGKIDFGEPIVAVIIQVFAGVIVYLLLLVGLGDAWVRRMLNELVVKKLRK